MFNFAFIFILSILKHYIVTLIVLFFVGFFIVTLLKRGGGGIVCTGIHYIHIYLIIVMILPLMGP